MKTYWKGYILAATAALLLSSIGVLGKIVYVYHVDPLLVVSLRAAIASITLAGILIVYFKKLPRISVRDLPFFAIYGIVGVAANHASYFYALKYTTVTTAVILLYTYPAIVTLISLFTFHENVNSAKAVALLLTFAGCFMVIQGYDLTRLQLNFNGIVYGLVAGFTAALYSLFGKKAIQKYTSTTAVLYSFCFSATFLFLLRAPRISELILPFHAWIIILLIAWVPTLLAYAMYTESMKYIEVSRASITCTIEPVGAMLMAFFFLDEHIEFFQIIGAALTLIGVIILHLKSISKRKQSRIKR